MHGPSLLDITPTILALYGLAAGEDMDGKVLSQAFVKTPDVRTIPSWEDVPGRDGRHPPHMRLDPVAAHQALEQMIALGYIDRPDENREIAVENTIRELRYNLGEAYQDGDRHLEAHAIFTELCAADADELRFAVRLFVSCQALGFHAEMRRTCRCISMAAAAGCSKRRRQKSSRCADSRSNGAQASGKVEAEPESLLTEGERRELARWRNLARFQPPLIDYLKGQVLTAEKRYREALEALELVTEAHLDTAGPLPANCRSVSASPPPERCAEDLRTGARDRSCYNVPAHLGMCRVWLSKEGKFSLAAKSALDALQRRDHYPLAHFLLAARAGRDEGIRARCQEAASARPFPSIRIFPKRTFASRRCSKGHLLAVRPNRRRNTASLHDR